MAVLPEDTTDTNGALGVTFVSQPSLTWSIDKETNQIVGETEGLEAVRQAAEIILNVERFRWQIYQAFSGIQLENLIGQNAGYVGAEMQRRIRDALMVDDRITGISDFTYSMRLNVLTASFTINTVYGDTTTEMEAVLT